ncbi:hypothetical protein BLOT_013800 [Blomia tropicalis]|nr:hypothetical protein BLOT_013800 [Blomia tropicalis]
MALANSRKQLASQSRFSDLDSEPIFSLSTFSFLSLSFGWSLTLGQPSQSEQDDDDDDDDEVDKPIISKKSDLG